jgi:hypothetical protein
MIRKSGNRFSLATNAKAFARRSCSNKKMNDEHDSTLLNHALEALARKASFDLGDLDDLATLAWGFRLVIHLRSTSGTTATIDCGAR